MSDQTDQIIASLAGVHLTPEEASALTVAIQARTRNYPTEPGTVLLGADGTAYLLADPHDTLPWIHWDGEEHEWVSEVPEPATVIHNPGAEPTPEPDPEPADKPELVRDQNGLWWVHIDDNDDGSDWYRVTGRHRSHPHHDRRIWGPRPQ